MATVLGSEPAVKLNPSDFENAIIVSWDSVFRVNFKVPPFHPDELITTKGFDVMDDMLTMSAYRAPMNIKRYALQNKGWKLKPVILEPNNLRHPLAMQIAEAAQWHHENILDPETDAVQPMEDCIWEGSSAFHIGYSAAEIEYRYVEEGPFAGQIGFKRFSFKPAKQIGFALHPYNLSVRSFVSYNPMTGYQNKIPVEKMFLYTYQPSKGLPYGNGDCRPCHKNWWILDMLEKMEAIALERHGAPFFVVKGPITDPVKAQEVMDRLAQVRQGADVMLPDGLEYEVHMLSGNSLTAIEAAKSWHAQQIMMVVLGNQLTMAQGTGNGTWALGNVHEHTQDYSLGYARKTFCAAWRNQVLRRWTRYNYGPENVDLAPVLDLGDWDAKDMLLLAQATDLFLKNGVLFRTEAFIRERGQMPPMDEESKKLMEEERAKEEALAEKQAQSKNSSGGSK